MPVVVNTNSTATTASGNLTKANDALRKSLNRLSSGKRIVSPADDAGGMAFAYKLGSKRRRTEAVIMNVQNALSYLQVQDTALQTVGNILDRMAELRTMAADITKATADVANYSKEFTELQNQLQQTSREQFNGVSLFSAVEWGDQTVNNNDVIEVLTSERGSSGSKVSLGKIQLLSAMTVKSGTYSATGATTTAVPTYANMTIDNYVVQEHAENKSLATRTQSVEDGLGFDHASLGTFSVDSFILGLQNVSTLRAENGAISSRLQFAMEQLESAKVNLEAANSRIMDTDVAQESTRFARYSILTQAGAAMLSQANNSQTNILQMLLL